MKALIISLMASLCSLGHAQIIYSNFFNGVATTLNGTAPAAANGFAGGINNALWTCTFSNGLTGFANSMDGTVLANGAIATNPGCALLPFTPQPGCVYFMTASLTMPSGMANWVAMGFTQFATQTNNQSGAYSRFTDNPPNGYAWLAAYAGHFMDFYAGPKTGTETDSGLAPSPGTYTLDIRLNTMGAKWTVSAYINGVISGTNIVGGTQIGTNVVYATNPTIGFAGLGQTAFAGQNTSGIQWNYWTLSVVQPPTPTNSYWVAPTALGTGDGSSPVNAAYYLNSSFWSQVQSQLGGAYVTVNFLGGSYNAGTLNLNDLGNPLHQLCLQAVSQNGPILSTTGSTIIGITGSQNIKFSGLTFTGPCSSWGIDCQPDYLKPCRNLEFSHCQLINLTNAYYGVIGLVNGARDITVDNCTFTNNTNGSHQHLIYASHDIVNVVVTNCVFQDCLADYLRFRDDSDYCVVDHCTFISTLSASAWPFVSVELYNDTDPGPGDEFFGTHFQISNTSFTYNASGGPGPYSALHFSDSGYSPQSYDCDLTPTQASQLGSGTVAFQQSFLQTNMGIIGSEIKMFGNTYNSRVAYRMDYAYSWDDTSAPYGGWQGTVNLSNVPDSSGALPGPAPLVRNGNFDQPGQLLLPVTSSTPNECLFRTWFCNPKYATLLSHPGFNGTTNALRFNGKQTQYIYQWITCPGPSWTMDCLVAIGSFTNTSGLVFQADIFHNDITGGKVSVGVDYLGRFGIYNGGTFTVLPELGTVAFSTDHNGNGNYTDPGDILNVYRLRIVGHYAAGSPYVNIYTSDANNPALNHQSPGRAYYVNGAPISGQSSPGTLAFYNYSAPVILDQVAVAAGLAEQPPVINNLQLSSGRLILSGTNGFAGDPCYLLASTNPVLPTASWTCEATNLFSGNAFSFTNALLPGAPQKFYQLKIQ